MTAVQTPPRAASLFLFTTPRACDRAANLLAAARALAANLARSRPLDRRMVSSVMTTAFGGSDAEGLWAWRDAYEAIEAATVLQIRRLTPQISRLEDAPAGITALLATVGSLGLTHSRRTEDQLALDQFSTPPELAALVVLAAQVRPGDKVLEPSAGTGLVAVVAEACGGVLTLNELADGRAALLDGLFASAARSRVDGRHVQDLLPGAGGFDVAVCNPPFSDLEAHLTAAFAALADGGRLAAVLPMTALTDEGLMRRLSARGRVLARSGFPPRAFAKHGTSVETGLLVLDRREAGAEIAFLTNGEDLAACAALAAAVPERATAKPRVRLELAARTLLAPRDRSLALPSGRLGFLAGASPVAYETRPWSGEGRDVGLYQAHRLARIALPVETPHPSALVESGPMASVAPPAPSYRPVLPPAVRDEGRISDAQLETVIYAGEAHAGLLPAWWTPGDAAHQLRLSREEAEGAVQLRRGFFLGDGTGCGKGREIAAVIADNMAQGRTKALWLSKNDALLDDARRDWSAIGGGPHNLVPLNSWKLGEGVRLDRGIVFTTYATLRQPARGQKASRLDQIVAWLGEDFDGIIAFDEAHAMANAAGGGKGARGTKKASLQGMAGLALQNRLPNARVLYVSATGATTAENLAYAVRLGLWGGPEAPFVTRDDFLDAMDRSPHVEDERKGGLGRSGIGEIGSPAASDQQETDMQTMVFTGRLAADPQISDDFGKAVFRLLEQRGTDNAGKPRLVGVNCVSWSKGLNEKVIARGLAQGCEAVVIGAFIDTAYTARDGSERTAKELVINRLTVLDWAEDRQAEAADDRVAA